MSDYERFFNQLNPAQQAAVRSIEGPVMVLAGPGTGKTQVVAMRIGQILKQTQLGPQNILALTFTEAGVTALRERLAKIIGPDAYRVTISTFHGLSNQVIASFPHVFIQTRSLTQLNDLDRFLLLNQILEQNQQLTMLRPLRKPDLFVADISRAIKTCKQESITPEHLLELSQEEFQQEDLKALTKIGREARENQYQRLQEFAAIYRLYQEKIKEFGYYDYEDMILFVIAALKNDADVRAYFQERYQYLLVDEYQDTNNAQNELVETLADFFTNPNLFVVGDDKQAIYRFQGASVANMLHFQQRYTSMKIISLTDNYRSTPEILTSAQQLIRHNAHQISQFLPGIDDTLLSHQPKNAQPTLAALPSSMSEHDYIIETLQNWHQAGIAWNEMAVLWRRNSEVRSFRLLAEKLGVPVAGEVTSNLVSEPEIQLFLQVLRAIANPLFDQAVFTTCRLMVNGPSLLELFKANGQAAENRQRLIEVLAASSEPSLAFAAQRILDWNQLSVKISLPELLEQIMEDSTVLEATRARPELLEGLELIGALMQLACEYSSRNQTASLADWLTYVDLLQAHNLQVPVVRSSPERTGVMISTLHGSKGLEFEAVVLAGVDEKCWNSRSARQIIKLPSTIVGLKNWEDDEAEDERRLFYVGITRAKKQLLLAYSHTANDGKQQLACQFVAEIEPSLQRQAVKVSQQRLITAQQALLRPRSVETIQQTELAFIREKIKNSPFSQSDLRAYQTCPRQYLLNRVLKLPTLPGVSLLYGSAIHRALELFFRDYRGLKKLPSKKKLLDHLHEAVFSTVPYSDRQAVYSHAEAVLAQFYDQKSTEWPIPLSVEYSFSPHQVMLGDIWITGKYDRVDALDPSGQTARVIDYKTTSKPLSRNEIEGKTKNSDGDYYHQLIFYALLAEKDRLLPYTVKEFTIAFIDDKGSFKEEPFTISQTQTKALAEEIKTIYQEIITREDFPHTRDTFDKGCEICEAFPSL